MIIRNGIRSNLRARRRTVLFAGMILVLTLVMILALGVRLYSASALAQCEESYRSIALVEYMGTEYPSTDEPDTAAREAAAAIDGEALRALPGVNAWYRDCHTLSRIEGYKRKGNDMPYKDYGVIVVSRLQPQTLRYWTISGRYKEERYYTGLITQSLYSYDGKENVFVSVLSDNMPEDVQREDTYVFHGKFVDGDEYDISNGIPTFLVMPFPETDDSPMEKLGEEKKPSEVFQRAAEQYEILNNTVHTITCEDLNDLWEFQQGILYLREGSMPSGEKECVVSPYIADEMGLSPGDSLELTAFSSAEDNFYYGTLSDQRETWTITGVTNDSGDYRGYVWCQAKPPETTLYGYRLGIASLKNSTGIETVEQMKPLMPANVRVTLLDQGYAETVEPFLSLQTTATNVLLMCVIGTAAVLVLFALLFVGRQNETVRILVSLGTSRGKIALWLLSGALVIAGGAALLGGALGFWGLPFAFQWIQDRAAQEGELLRFSETLVNIAKKVNISVTMPILPIVLTVAAIILLALLLCLLFLRTAYRGGTLRRGKSRVHVPSGRTSTFGRGSLRYALLSIRRGGRRALLVVAVSAVLTVLIIVLGGIYRGWENDLDAALHETKLEGQVTSSDGRTFSGLMLKISSVRELYQLPDVGEMYLSKPFSTYWLKEEIPTYGEQGLERRESWIASQPNIVAVNNLKAAKEFYFTDPEIEWADGWDESCLALDTYHPIAYWIDTGHKTFETYPAVVGRQFMESHGLQLGEEFQCMTRIGDWEISLPLCIVGAYSQAGSRAQIYLPLAAFCPPDVVFGEELQGSAWSYRVGAHTLDNYKALLLESQTMETCRFTLTSADHLDETRAHLAAEGFGWPGHLGARRTALILRDASFVKLTENLGRYLSMGRVMLGVILGVVALLGFIISWLLISGRKKEFVVMRGFGAKRRRLFFSFFWEQALLCLLGCAIGCAALLRFYAGGILQWLTLGAYVLCYLAGCAISIILISKMNLMDLLVTEE